MIRPRNFPRDLWMSGLIFALLGAASGQTQPAPVPAPAARPAPPRSPEIHADKTVTFRLLAPKSQEVTLNGSWENGRDVKMAKDDSGLWSVTVGPLPSQLFGYWFLVDGVK